MSRNDVILDRFQVISGFAVSGQSNLVGDTTVTGSLTVHGPVNFLQATQVTNFETIAVGSITRDTSLLDPFGGTTLSPITIDSEVVVNEELHWPGGGSVSTNQMFTDMSTNSGTWNAAAVLSDTTFNSISPASGTWNTAAALTDTMFNSISPISGDWNDTRTTLQTYSGDWQDIPEWTHTNFIHASGDDVITNTLTAERIVLTDSISGGDAIFTSLTALSSYVDVIDIKVRELSGYDIIDGDLSVDGNLTTEGTVTLSNQGLIFSDSETFTSDDSKMVTQTFNSISPASGTWNTAAALTDTTFNSISPASGTWNTTTSTVNTNSGNWETTYNDVSVSATHWNDTTTTVQTNSSSWAPIDTSNFADTDWTHTNFIHASGDDIVGGTLSAQNVVVKGDLTVDGDVTFKGSGTGEIYIGDSVSDDVVFVASVSSDILPDNSHDFNLGSASQPWNNVYTDHVTTPVIGEQTHGVRLWTPENVTSNLSGWWDASDDSSITLGSGNSITEWRDKSGSGYDLTVVTSGRVAPLSGTRELNGLNVLEFIDDGTSRTVLENDTFEMEQDPETLYICFVVHVDDVASAQDFFMSGETGDGTRLLARRTSAGRLDFAGLMTADNTINTGETYIISVKLQGTGSTIRVNGVQRAAGTVNATKGIIGGLNIGTNFGEDQGLDGYLAEIIICDGGESELEIEGYLAHKWGVILAPSSTHTYKSIAPKYDTGEINLDGNVKIDGSLILKANEPTHGDIDNNTGVLYVSDGELHYKGKTPTGTIITKRLAP